MSLWFHLAYSPYMLMPKEERSGKQGSILPAHRLLKMRLHLSPAFWTDERIDLIDLLYHLSPSFGGGQKQKAI
ncbi:MAG: hypothetical protein ACOC5F_05750 [Candidatus Aminicenantaceae bacterium]